MDNTTPTLLVFEWFGEADIGIYLIPDPPEWLSKIDGEVGNGCDEESIEDLLIRVSDAICDTPEYYTNADDSLAGAWVKYKVAQTFHAEGPVQVIRSGWVP